MRAYWSTQIDSDFSVKDQWIFQNDKIASFFASEILKDI